MLASAEQSRGSAPSHPPQLQATPQAFAHSRHAVLCPAQLLQLHCLRGGAGCLLWVSQAVLAGYRRKPVTPAVAFLVLKDKLFWPGVGLVLPFIN